MPSDDLAELIAAARPLLGEIALASPDTSAATVACALRAASGRVFTGVCVHLRCGIGFCAEHAAVAEMIKHRETHVVAIAAVRAGVVVVAPCGRCRELLAQVDVRNLDARVALPGDRAATLRDLLPER